MATYTPNYNLGKPEPTDPFGYNSFLPLFNDNMDKIDQIGGGGSANIVSLTQAEYDALPSSKESDNVLYLAYFDGGQTLDPDYSYHKYGDDDEIIVRVYHEGQLDQQTLWFFRGWNQTSGDMAIPTELASYKPANPSSAVYSANYPNGGTSQDGWIGFYNNNIRAWVQNLTQTTTGVMYGVVDIAGGERQSLSYVDDPYVYIQDADATRRIYYNGREYAEFNSGSGGGGSSYTSDVLFTNSGTSIPSTIPLSKGMSNYDMIVFSGYRQQYQTYWSSRAYLASEISAGKVVGLVDDAMYAWYTVTDDTTLTLAPTANIVIDKVYGLKFSRGGSGGITDVEVNGESVVDPDTKIASITSYFTVINGELCQIYDDGN